MLRQTAYMGELADQVRRVIDSNLYMVLATADRDGTPQASPVFYGARDYRELYWVSAPDAVHSVNLAERPEVSIVIFDSTSPVGQGGQNAVYLAATAATVDTEDDVRDGFEVWPGPPERGGRVLAPEEVLPPGTYRFYQATITDMSVLCPQVSGMPCELHGRLGPHRTPVDL